MTRRFWRIRKHMLVAAASLPLLQATCVDPVSVFITTGTNFAQTLASTWITNFLGGITTILIQTFPSANLLRILLGFGGIVSGT